MKDDLLTAGCNLSNFHDALIKKKTIFLRNKLFLGKVSFRNFLLDKILTRKIHQGHEEAQTYKTLLGER